MPRRGPHADAGVQTDPESKDRTVSRQPLAPQPTLHHLVRKTAAQDLTTMGSVLAAAFHDDPVISWMVPDEARRRTGLAAIMELFAARSQPHGENHLNDTGTGAAVWAPPAAAFAPEDEERFGADLAAVAGDDLARVGELGELLDRHHPHEPHHYYLMLLGVRPDHQGTGIGGALLRAVLDRADRDGVPAYLEATSLRNRALYERHGFEVTAELRTSDCPPLWAMWRHPRPALA
jgi:GNAT superfamily N-acetyltransferase